MKTCVLFLMMCCLLTGPCLAYTVSGKVYLQGTTTPVANAIVSISSGGSSGSTTTDSFGSFSIGWTGANMIGNMMTLTADKNFLHGQTSWQASQNSENKDVYVSSTIELDPSLNLQSMPAHWTGAGPTTVNSSVYLNSTVASVQLQNAAIDISFNNSIQNVTYVEPSPWIAPYLALFNWDSPAGSGQLHLNIEFATPFDIPEIPPESFFDVTYEVEIPGDDATTGTVDIENAILLAPGGIELSAPICSTEYLVGEPALCKPHFLIDSELEWLEALNADWPQANIIPMSPAEWNNPDWGYMMQWSDYLEEGDPYPTNEFLPPELYVYPGDDDESAPDPDSPGLVMRWGEQDQPAGGYSSAWKYDYGLDPDLSNSIITVTVMPPSGSMISNISLGMQDVNGNIRSWHWTCGPTGVIPYDVKTPITIDTTITGLAAATPAATGYANNPAFNLKQVQNFIADENSTWVGGPTPVPPAGQTGAIWNYWYYLKVTPKLPGGGVNSKWFVKWSQPPVEVEEGLIEGWDEQSVYINPPIMADDWQCDSTRPVTDIHWWGSFVGWTQPHLPPVVPSAFHIGIWTDVPAGVDQPYSHPGQLVWENVCTTAVWNFAGYDRDPREGDPAQQEDEACFQWAQFLNQDEWFWQEEGTNIYWLSIAAIYPAGTDFLSPDFFPWGWKTRQHHFNDDAIRITDATVMPPTVGAVWNAGDPVEWPQGISWDLAFELTTNEPAYIDDPIPGDIGGPGGILVPDGIVNINDFAIMAAHWLETAP